MSNILLYLQELQEKSFRKDFYIRLYLTSVFSSLLFLILSSSRLGVFVGVAEHLTRSLYISRLIAGEIFIY